MKIWEILKNIILVLSIFVLFVSVILVIRANREFHCLREQIEKFEKELEDLKLKIRKLSDKFSEAKRLVVIATAYTSSREECDDTPFITASGKKVRWGIIAADKSIPFGTKVYIPYFKQTFVVEDRGGAIKGNRIDIWMEKKEDAIKFGKRKLVIYILGE